MRPVWLRSFSDRFGLYDKHATPIMEPMTYEHQAVLAFKERLFSKLKDLADETRASKGGSFDMGLSLRADTLDLAASLVLTTPVLETPEKPR